MLFKIFNKYLQDCLLKNCIIVTHKLTHNFTKNNFLGEICPSAKKEESCTFSNFRMVAKFTLTMSSNHFHEFFFFSTKTILLDTLTQLLLTTNLQDSHSFTA